VLGLAKILWAVEILLEMDIPEFQADLLDAEPRWHDVESVDPISKGEVIYRSCDGRSVFDLWERRRYSGLWQLLSAPGYEHSKTRLERDKIDLP